MIDLLREATDMISGLDRSQVSAVNIVSLAAFAKVTEASRMIDECTDIKKTIVVRLDTMTTEVNAQRGRLDGMKDHLPPEEYAITANMIAEQLRRIETAKMWVYLVVNDLKKYREQCVHVTALLIGLLKDCI